MRRYFLVTLALAACGEPMCKRTCETVKPQLIRDFSVPSVDCDEPKWQTDDCQQCDAIFRRDYGVALTGGGSCAVSLEPAQAP